MRFSTTLFVWFCLLSQPCLKAQHQAEFLPQEISGSEFQSLNGKSPFTRSLNLPNNLILTGVAELAGRSAATVVDAETGSSTMITETENELGWKLVKISDPVNLDETIVTISKGDGDTFRIAYDRKLHEQIAEKYRAKRKASLAAARKPQTDSRDKKPDKPAHQKPTEAEKAKYAKVKSRWQTMSKDQQTRARSMISEMNKTTPGMTHSQRADAYGEIIDKITSGR